MVYHIYRNVKGQWRWRLRAANNRIIANSGESYRNKKDCLAGIALTKGSFDATLLEKGA